MLSTEKSCEFLISNQSRLSRCHLFDKSVVRSIQGEDFFKTLFIVFNQLQSNTI